MHTLLRNKLSPQSARKILNYTMGFFTFFVIWYLISRFQSNPALPGPIDVFKTAFRLIGDPAYFLHIGASLKIVLLGIGLAMFVGISTGIVIFRYSFVKKAMLPIIECVRGVSALTLFPLLIILFGLGTFSRVAVIFWTAWPAIILATIQSLDVDKNAVEAARNCGASEWQTIFLIRIPMSLGGIMTGVRIGFGGGWISLIAAEMLGASKGIGYYLMWSSQSFEFEKVYASIVIIAAVGGFMNIALLVGQKHYLTFVGV